MKSAAADLSSLDLMINDAEGYAENLMKDRGLFDVLNMTPVLHEAQVRFVSVITQVGFVEYLKK